MRWEFASKHLKSLYEEEKGANKYEPAVVDAFFSLMARIDAAIDERDLRQLKSRRLEKLKGDRAGQYSMRLNDQWRLILEITEDEQGKRLLVIEITDYH
jgi:proteic killer suppression protein